MKVIFLDIDGVLNGHEFMSHSQSSSINRDCMARLNRIVRLTGCKVVISSAWRYIISGGDMTLKGFGYLLRTHGFAHPDALLGHTEPDEAIGTRGGQVAAFLTGKNVSAYIAVDDLTFDFAERGIPHHQTAGDVGLTDEDVEIIVAVLGVDAEAKKGTQ